MVPKGINDDTLALTNHRPNRPILSVRMSAFRWRDSKIAAGRSAYRSSYRIGKDAKDNAADLKRKLSAVDATKLEWKLVSNDTLERLSMCVSIPRKRSPMLR